MASTEYHAHNSPSGQRCQNFRIDPDYPTELSVWAVRMVAGGFRVCVNVPMFARRKPRRRRRRCRRQRTPQTRTHILTHPPNSAINAVRMRAERNSMAHISNLQPHNTIICVWVGLCATWCGLIVGGVCLTCARVYTVIRKRIFQLCMCLFAQMYLVMIGNYCGANSPRGYCRLEIAIPIPVEPALYI